MKWLKRLTAGLLSAAVLATLFVSWLLLRSVPDSSPHTTGAAVSAPVKVIYDKRLRPFVYAERFDDAFLAQGYLHAKHRLWQMDMFRRAGLGRIAELIGPQGLETDIEIWRAGVPELAQRMARVASPSLKASISAYVAGVNTFLAEQRPLPPEYLLLQIEPRPWSADDVFALGALMAYQSANNLTDELLRLALVTELGISKAGVFFPEAEVVPDPLVVPLNSIYPALRHTDLVNGSTNPLFSAPAMGSNAWAVAPPMTASGTALFAFDSHDSVSLPNLTYDVHLFAGRQQIRGNSVPGLPGVINGFNEFMAWGFTNIGDSQDAFIESNAVDRDVQSIRIPVRGESDKVADIVTTANGRLISLDPPIAVRWAPLEPHEFGLDALLALNRATSFAQFNDALDSFVAPSATATYADITGRVAQRTVGLLPQRGSGAGLLPLSSSDPGNSSASWTGMLDMSGLPAKTTTQTYVAAANRPFTDSGMLISADNAPGYRVRRIHQLLGGRQDHDVDSMLALQTDYANLQSRRLLPGMLDTLQAAKDRAALSATEAEVFDLLLQWSAAPEDLAGQPAPALFAMWYQQFIRQLFQPVLTDETYQRLLRRSYLINEAIDNQLLQRQTDWPVQKALEQSFTQAVAELPAEPRSLRWGHHHQLLLKHELGSAFPGAGVLFNRGPYPADGGNATVGRARYSHARPYGVSGGATTRMVLEMSDPIQAWMISPGGQSGHPLSDWYNDQTAGWLAGRADKIEPPQKPVADILITPNS